MPASQPESPPTVTHSAELKLSVVITAFSETQSLLKTVEQVIRYTGPDLYEIVIVVAPASIPETFAICDRLSKQHGFIKVLTQKKFPGAGWAFQEGFAIATGSHILMMAADGETDPALIPTMIERLKKTGCDLVAANRWLPGGGFHGYSKLKLVLNWIFQQIFKALLHTQVGDLTYSYRILEIGMVRRIRWESGLHEFFFETAAKPIKLGYRVEEVPATWVCREEGTSKNTFLRNFRYFKVGLKVWLAPPEALVREQPGDKAA